MVPVPLIRDDFGPHAGLVMLLGWSIAGMVGILERPYPGMMGLERPYSEVMGLGWPYPGMMELGRSHAGMVWLGWPYP